ncbi:MAG: polysaccharide deacetylase family protein, partial [Halobacteriales archaeon]|nr:polysaccharide deacetylase family protein [Halobacteriales archaeon]
TDVDHKGRCENVEGINIHVSDFRAICQLLAERYNVVPLSAFCRAVMENRPLPPRSVVLTFDDGNESKFRLGFPILQEFGLPATIYLATDFVENGTFLWWDRVEYAVARAKADLLLLTINGEPVQVSTGTERERCEAFLGLMPKLKSVPQENLLIEVEQIENVAGVSLMTADSVPAIYRPMSWENAREMLDSDLVEIGAHTHTHRILGRCEVVEGHVGQSQEHFLKALELAREADALYEEALALEGLVGTDPDAAARRTGRARHQELIERLGLVARPEAVPELASVT